LKISKENKKIIVDEFVKVFELMNGTKNTREKLFYFSATYAMVSRILNIEYDPMLVLIHSVLSSTYSNINSFINNVANSKETFYIIPENYFGILESTLKKITKSIDSNNEPNIYDALKGFSVLAYIFTGNGNYLYKKGTLKINI
jgi:hypothetical protein